MSESLGELNSANELLNDWEWLNASFQNEGYVFFRGVLDPEQVCRTKLDFIRVLEEQGAVKPGVSEPVWTGASFEQIDDNALYALDSHEELLESARTKELLEKVFGETVFRYRNTTIRFALPHDEMHVSPPHQDHYFIRQTPEFRTVWVPLMAIDSTVGGLAIAAGSHKKGLVGHVEQEGAYSYILKGRKQRGVPPEHIRDAWLTAFYQPGDVLIFHSHMIHRGLPNCSDRIRLSLDTRFQPAHAPRTWQAERTILELRQYQKEAMGIAAEEGVSEDFFEALIIEMMKRGIEVEEEQVKALIAELSGSSDVGPSR